MFPTWLPEDVIAYLHHEKSKLGIRPIARMIHVHPSTVMRRVRRVSKLRATDPAVDLVLSSLLSSGDAEDTGLLGETGFKQAARSVLPGMARTGARLAWAPGVANAVLAHSAGDEVETLGAVSAEICGFLALWGLTEVCSDTAKLQKYRITASGRQWLVQEVANREAAVSHWGDDPIAVRRAGQALGPLDALLRRRSNGELWLADDLAKVAKFIRRDWISAGRTLDETDAPYLGQAAQEARLRLRLAFADLGQSATLELLKAYCITDESIEATEHRLSLPARSGKALFREGLVRVKRIYDAQSALKTISVHIQPRPVINDRPKAEVISLKERAALLRQKIKKAS